MGCHSCVSSLVGVFGSPQPLACWPQWQTCLRGRVNLLSPCCEWKGSQHGTHHFWGVKKHFAIPRLQSKPCKIYKVTYPILCHFLTSSNSKTLVQFIGVYFVGLLNALINKFFENVLKLCVFICAWAQKRTCSWRDVWLEIVFWQASNQNNNKIDVAWDYASNY